MVRQVRPISPFLSDFVIDDILQIALIEVWNGGVDPSRRERLFDIKYSEDSLTVL